MKWLAFKETDVLFLWIVKHSLISILISLHRISDLLKLVVCSSLMRFCQHFLCNGVDWAFACSGLLCLAHTAAAAHTKPRSAQPAEPTHQTGVLSPDQPAGISGISGALKLDASFLEGDVVGWRFNGWIEAQYTDTDLRLSQWCHS